MIHFSISLNILLILSNVYLFNKLSELHELVKKLEIIATPPVNVENPYPCVEIVIVTFFSILLVFAVCRGVNFVGDTSAYKLVKLVDSKTSSIINYFSKSENNISFIEKSTGYHVNLKTCGDVCDVLFKPLNSCEYVSLKTLIEASEIVTESIDIASVGPCVDSIAFFNC